MLGIKDYYCANTNNGQLFEVKKNMDCSSKNLLYVIKCSGCGKDYIGETGNELRKRMTVHRQQIRDPTINMIPLSAHLRICAKDKENNFTLFPFYKFADNTTETQLNKNVKESEFITKCRPKLNKLQYLFTQ